MSAVQRKLIRQVIRSLREHPEDWKFGDRWAVNEHLKIRVYKRYHAPFLDVWYKDEQIVKDWRNPFAYLVPWRCRLLQVVRSAERDCAMKKASLKIEDSFDTPTTSMDQQLGALMARIIRLEARLGPFRRAG